MVLFMKVNVFSYVKDFIDESSSIYIDDIRGDNPTAFTRSRILNPYILLLQMFNNKGTTQDSELRDLFKTMQSSVKTSAVAFYNARMKFYPEALKLMSKDFISEIYDRENESMVKLNGYIVTAIDGSDFILPSTKENGEIYGYHKGNESDEENSSVMGKLSIIYDCINKCTFDSEVGEYKHDEIDFASKHLKSLKEILKQKTITTFDRGYFSFALVHQMMHDQQKFLFRMKRNVLKEYVEQVKLNEDKTFDITLDTKQTNQFRNNKKLRIEMMNTTYRLRIVKVPIKQNESGDIIEEILVTNLSEDEFDIEALKELYHLRWEIETAYNVMKNRMKLEEFSGKRDRLILQDIYTCIWLYNIIMLRIIELNEEYEIPEDRYKYEMKRNNNQAIGIVKDYFLCSIILAGTEEATNYFNECTTEINKHLVPVRPNRHYKRKNTKKNKSRASYRYSY